MPGAATTARRCWLPIDAKFPLEDWQRLQDALERADAGGVEAARKALEDRVRKQAQTISRQVRRAAAHDRFRDPVLPTESLYAEMMSRPGLADTLQREHRVTLAGPTNFAAMLNSLQMGFRTLAIEQRSSEVWRVLGAVKTEFGKFGDVLARTQGEARQGRAIRSRTAGGAHDDRAQAARRRGAAGSRSGRPSA